MTFEKMLTLIEDRSAALRAAAAEVSADSLVPGCPDWTVRDLVTHLGEVQRTWAFVVAAGPSQDPPEESDFEGQDEPGDDLMGWSAESTAQLVAALRAAGPDRPCWTWWAGASTAPANSGAVARHQVQEAAVHAFDAQESAGRPEPLPAEVAADGIGEYLSVGMASLGPWPHEPGRVALAASDAGSWVVDLSGAGAQATGYGPGERLAQPGAWLRGTASDLVLSLYGRATQDGLDITGDTELAEQLLDWPDNE